MGALFTFQPLSDRPAALMVRIQRLRARSRILAALFGGLFWLCAAATSAMLLTALFYHGRHIAFGPMGGIITFADPAVLPPDYRWLADIALRYRLGLLFAGITQFGPAVMVLAHLRGLFRLYARGIVFATENARSFKQMGIWLIAYAVMPCLSVTLLSLIDCVIDRAWYHNAELYALGLGMVLFVIAEVMEAGREIEQDRDAFV